MLAGVLAGVLVGPLTGMLAALVAARVAVLVAALLAALLAALVAARVAALRAGILVAWHEYSSSANMPMYSSRTNIRAGFNNLCSGKRLVPSPFYRKSPSPFPSHK